VAYRYWISNIKNTIYFSAVCLPKNMSGVLLGWAKYKVFS